MTRRYSFSMLDTFHQCPFKWWEIYVNKVPRLPPTPELTKGNVQHKEFEDVFALRREPTKLTRPYIPAFQKLAATRAVFAEAEFGITKAGKPSQSRKWGTDCYLFGKIDLALVPHILGATEFRIPQREIWAGTGSHKGADMTAYVNDWKTGKPGYPNKFQLDIYSTFILAYYPLKVDRVASRLTYTSHDKFYPEGDGEWYIRTRQQFDELLGTVHARTDAIEAAERSKTFEKKPGPLCRFCPSTRCKESPQYVAR